MPDAQALTGAQILEQIKPKPHEKGTYICLRADLVDDYYELNDKLAESQTNDASSARLASGVSAASKKLAKEIRDLEEQIEASQVRFLFRSISKARYSELVDLNPPRDDNVYDLTVGYNRDGLQEAQIRESLVSPTFEDCDKRGCQHDDCGSWQALLKVLNPSEYGELVRVSQEVNGVVTEAPKSQLASRILDKGGSSSKRRHGSE